MKAPDKVHVCLPQRLNMSAFKEDTKYVGMAYTDRGNLKSRQIEEYIRKDAILEWAEDMSETYRKRYDESNHTCGEHWGQMAAFQRVIDKLNSM